MYRNLEYITSSLPNFAYLNLQSSATQNFDQAQVTLIDEMNYKLDFQLRDYPTDLKDFFFQFEVLNENEISSFDAVSSKNDFQTFVSQMLSTSIFGDTTSISSNNSYCSLNDTTLQCACGFDTFLANAINFQITCPTTCPTALALSMNFHGLIANSLYTRYNFSFNLRLISQSTHAVYAQSLSVPSAFQTFNPTSPELTNSLANISLTSLDFRYVLLVLNFTINNDLSSEYLPLMSIDFKDITVLCDQTLFEDYNCYFQAGISATDSVYPVNFNQISNSELQISKFASVPAGTHISLVVQAVLPATFPTSPIDIMIYQTIQNTQILTCVSLNASNSSLASGYTSSGSTYPATVSNVTYYTNQSLNVIDLVVDINPTGSFPSLTTIEFTFYPLYAFSVNLSVTATQALRLLSGNWIKDTRRTVTQSAASNLIDVKNTVTDNSKATMRVSIQGLQVISDPRANSRLVPFVRARALYLGSEAASDWEYFNDTMAYFAISSFSVANNAENVWSIYFFNLSFSQGFSQSFDGEYRLRLVFSENFLPAIGYDEDGISQKSESLYCNFTDSLPLLPGSAKRCVYVSPREILLLGYAGFQPNSSVSWQMLVRNPMMSVPSLLNTSVNSTPKVNLKLEGQNTTAVYYRIFSAVEIPLARVIQSATNLSTFSEFTLDFVPTTSSVPATMLISIMTPITVPQLLLNDSSNMLLLSLPAEFDLDDGFTCHWMNQSLSLPIVATIFSAQGVIAPTILPQNMILFQSSTVLSGNLEHNIACTGFLFPFIEADSQNPSLFLTNQETPVAYGLNQNPTSNSSTLIVDYTLNTYFEKAKSELTIQIESKILVRGNISMNITLPQFTDYTQAQLKLSLNQDESAFAMLYDSFGGNLTIGPLDSVSYNSSLIVVISNLINPEASKIATIVIVELYEVQNGSQNAFTNNSVPFEVSIVSVPATPEQTSSSSTDFALNQSEQTGSYYLSVGLNTSNSSLVNGFFINLPDLLSAPGSFLPEISCAILFSGARQEISSCSAVSKTFISMMTMNPIPMLSYSVIVISGLSMNQGAENKLLILTSVYDGEIVDQFSVSLNFSNSTTTTENNTANTNTTDGTKNTEIPENNTNTTTPETNSTANTENNTTNTNNTNNTNTTNDTNNTEFSENNTNTTTPGTNNTNNINNTNSTNNTGNGDNGTITPTNNTSDAIKTFVLDLIEGRLARSLIQFTVPFAFDTQRHKIIISFDADIQPDATQTQAWIVKLEQNYTALTLEDYLDLALDEFVQLNSSAIGTSLEIYGITSTGESLEKFSQTFNRSQENTTNLLESGESVLFTLYPLNSATPGTTLSLSFSIYDSELNQTVFNSPDSLFTTQSPDVPSNFNSLGQVSRSDSNFFHLTSLSFSLAFEMPATNNPLALKIPLPNDVIIIDEFFSQGQINGSLSSSGNSFPTFHSIYDPLSCSLYIILSSGILTESLIEYQVTINNVVNLDSSEIPSTLSLALVDLTTSAELITFSEAATDGSTAQLYKANQFVNIYYQYSLVPLEDEIELSLGTLSQPIQLVLEDCALFSSNFSITLTLLSFNFVTHQYEDATSSFLINSSLIQVPAGSNSVSFQLGTSDEGFYLIKYTFQAADTSNALYLLPSYTKISVSKGPLSMIYEAFSTFYPSASNLPLNLYIQGGLPLTPLTLTIETYIKAANSTNFTAANSSLVTQKLSPTFSPTDNQTEIQFDFQGLNQSSEIQLVLQVSSSSVQPTLPSFIFTPSVFNYSTPPTLSMFQAQSILKTMVIIEAQASQIGTLFFVVSSEPIEEYLQSSILSFDVVNESVRDISQEFLVDYGNGLEQKVVVGKKFVKQIGSLFTFVIPELDLGTKYYIYAYLQDVMGRISPVYSLQATTESKLICLMNNYLKIILSP